MATCNSCGGVIGVDCFNPSECQWISDQMERKSKDGLVKRVEELEAEVARLKEDSK